MDWRPIYTAASNNNVDELGRLENEGYSLSLADPVGGCSPLYVSCWYGCLEAVKFILHSHEGSESINSATVNGATPAYGASVRGKLDILKLLHEEGADLSTPDDHGITPLRAAMWHRHFECFHFLLSVDDVVSKINYMDKHGMNVLWVAVERGDEQAIKLLNDHGASFGNMPKRTSDSLLPPPDHCPTVSCINEPNQDRGLTNVHGKTSSTLECVALAAQSGDLDELVRLAAVGEHVDTVNALGITPLRLACDANHPTCVQFLVKRGSNKEARDRATGSTPLHAAASKGHTESVLVLLESGADVTSKRLLDGATPLLLACTDGYFETASALLDHPQIDANERNHQGMTPLELACCRNHTKIAELLINKGKVSSAIGVDPSLWMGLRFGSWMMRKQIPELAANQRILDIQIQVAEEERLLQEKEQLLKLANEKKSKKKPDKKTDKKEKKKR